MCPSVSSRHGAGTDQAPGCHATRRHLDKSSPIATVAAAGNGGAGASSTITYPALFPEVIAVGAVGQDQQRAEFSSIGQKLELVAPGSAIYSTLPAGGYGYKSGTSMAAPHVAGAAALAWSRNPNLRSSELRTLLGLTAKPFGHPSLTGYGLVDASAAVRAATEPPGRWRRPPEAGNKPDKEPRPGHPKKSNEGTEPGESLNSLALLDAPSLWATSMTTTSINLMWTSFPPVSGSVRYELAQWNPGSEQWDTVYSGPNTSYTVSGLQPETSYYFTVWANNGAWSPPAFNAYGYFFTGARWSGAQAGFSIKPEATKNTISLIGPDGARYVMYKWLNGNWVVLHDGSGRSEIDDNVQTGQTNFYMGWVDRTGSGDWVAVNGVGWVAVTTPPSTPAVAVTESGSYDVSLSWDSVNGAVSYRIYLNGTPVDRSFSTTYRVTGLVPSTPYSIQVVACDSSGLCGAPATVLATTAVGPAKLVMKAPEAGTRLGPQTQLVASFSGPAPTRVEFLLNDVPLGGTAKIDSTTSLASLYWRPTPAQSGYKQMLSAVAYFAAGQPAYSDKVPVTIEVKEANGKPVLAEGSEPTENGVKIQEMYGSFYLRSPFRKGDDVTKEDIDDWVLVNGQYNEPRYTADTDYYRNHQGVDLESGAGDPDDDEGRPTFAIAPGTVYKVADVPFYGNTVTIRHDVRGPNGENYPFYTMYAHLKSAALSDNQTVTEKTKVGITGKTGGKYDVHLHMEFQKSDDAYSKLEHWLSNGWKLFRSYAPALFWGKVNDTFAKKTSFIIHDKPEPNSNVVLFRIQTLAIGEEVRTTKNVQLHYSTNNGGSWETIDLTAGPDGVKYSYDFTKKGLEPGSTVLYYVTAKNDAWDYTGYYAAARPWHYTVHPINDPTDLRKYPFMIYIH